MIQGKVVRDLDILCWWVHTTYIYANWDDQLQGLSELKRNVQKLVEFDIHIINAKNNTLMTTESQIKNSICIIPCQYNVF